MTDQATTLQQPSIVGDVVRRLAGLYHAERIYLFGSAARGDAGRDSDYDFMVVVPDSTPPRSSEPRTSTAFSAGSARRWTSLFTPGMISTANCT